MVLLTNKYVLIRLHTPTCLQIVLVQLNTNLREISKIQTHEHNEDEEREENTQKISRARDLWPMHGRSLKGDFNKGKAIVPLEVKTKSNKDQNVVLDK